MQRIQYTQLTLKSFRTLFDEYKENLEPFFKDSRMPIAWAFHPNAVFERFNSFLERLHTIQWQVLIDCPITRPIHLIHCVLGSLRPLLSF